MATRCNYVFYSDNLDLLNGKHPQAIIYQHWDGDPDSVLPVLLPILRNFDMKRGLSDAGSAAAWLVKKLKKDMLNIRVAMRVADDAAYVYHIFPNRVEVYDTFENEMLKSVPIAPPGKDRVVFRMTMEDPEPIAFIVDDEANPGCIMSYMHTGQHGEASLKFYKYNTSPATEEQYLPLLREMTALGYDIKVYKKLPAKK